MNFIMKNKILILGQVESDKSIVYGVPKNTIEKTNYSLVSQVRIDNPNSYIIRTINLDIIFFF